MNSTSQQVLEKVLKKTLNIDLKQVQDELNAVG